MPLYVLVRRCRLEKKGRIYFVFLRLCTIMSLFSIISLLLDNCSGFVAGKTTFMGFILWFD